MAYKKEALEKLIKLVEEVSKEPENEWFKIEIEKRFSINSNAIHNEIQAVTNDLRRTSFFLKNIDKKFQIESFKFYKLIKSAELKQELIKDYKEMKVALLNNDLLEFGRRMTLQLERCFDTVIKEVDGWKIVKEQPLVYESVNFQIGTYNNTVRVTDNFYKKDFKDSSKKIKKEVSEIEFKTKALFCCLYYQINFVPNWTNLNNIYFLRNKASHSYLSPSELHKLQKIIDDFPKNQWYYATMFSSIINSLKDIFLTPSL